MNFLGQLSSNLSWFSSYLFSSSTQSSPKRISKQYLSHSKLTNLFTKHQNLQISASLPFYHLKKAKLRNENGILVFDYKEQNKEKKTCSFESEEQFNQWLNNQNYVGILEIKDERKEKPSIFYKLRSEKEENFETFNSDHALFTKITEKLDTALWKIHCLDNPDKNAQTIYIRAKKENWSDKLYFTPKNLEDLIHIVIPEEQNIDSAESKDFTGLAITAILLTGGLLAALKPTRMANTASLIQKLATPTAVGLFASSLYQPVAGQYFSPFANQPNLTISAYSGQPINILLSNYFKDLNPPSIFPLEYSVNSSLPSFVSYHSHPLSTFATLTIGDSQAGALSLGPNLYTFGGNAEPLRVWSTPNFNTRPDGLAAFQNAPLYLAGSMGGYPLDIGGSVSYLYLIHLAAGSVGCQHVPFDLPLSQSSTTAATTSVDHVVSKIGSPYFWHSDDTLLKSGNMTGKLTSTILTSYDASQSIKGLSLCQQYVYSFNDWVCLITDNTLRVINVQNPAALVQLSSIPLTSAPSGISCLFNRCFLAKGTNGIEAYDVSSQTPVLTASYSDSKNYTSLSFDGVLYTTTDDSSVEIFDVSNPAQIIPYRNISFATPLYSVSGGGNNFYVSTPTGVIVGNLNNDTISGAPTAIDRGTHRFNVTANNFLSDPTNFEVILNIEDYAPQVDNLLPPLAAYVDTPFSFDLSHVFSDRDDLLNTLNIVFNGPSFVNYSNFTIHGVASSILDEVNVTIVATDPYGKSATASTTFRVNPSVINITPPTSGNKGGLKTGAIVGIAIGAAGLIGLIIGGVIIWRKLRKEGDSTQYADTFDHSADVVNIKTVGFFGGNARGEHRYALLSWDSEQITTCQTATGLKPDHTGKIGQGAYGIVAVCWDVTNSRYMVMKTVEQESKFEQSKAEAELQKDAAGLGVWPVSNQIMDVPNNRLVFISPPAEFGDVDKLSRAIALVPFKSRDPDVLQQEREKFAICVAKGMLEGLVTLEQTGIVHADIKGSNTFVSKNGVVGLSDFGCATKIAKKQKTIPARKSDVMYKSPEEFTTHEIIVGKGDAWATGLTILTLLTGKSLRELSYEHRFRRIDDVLKKIAEGSSPTSDEYRQFNQAREGFLQDLHKNVEELKAPKPDSIWFVVKNLLNHDPDQRFTAKEALGVSCFAEFDETRRKKIFNSLFNKLQALYETLREEAIKVTSTSEVEMQPLQGDPRHYEHIPFYPGTNDDETPSASQASLMPQQSRNKLPAEANQEEPMTQTFVAYENPSEVPPRPPRPDRGNKLTPEMMQEEPMGQTVVAYTDFPKAN